MSLGILILLLGVAPLPLLSVNVAGSAGSLRLADLLKIDTINLPVVFRLAGLLALLLPMSRNFFLILAMWPILRNRAACNISRGAFRWAEILRIWSMIDVFMIGCAISLVELSAMATVETGQGFWLLIAVCVLTLFLERALCRHTLWKALERQGRNTEGAKDRIGCSIADDFKR